MHKHWLNGLQHYAFLLLVLYVLIITSSIAQPLARKKALNNSVPAIFVFGDSTADSGNNNDIRTILKSNFRPYGRDFPNQVPTGRFTNGRLPNDFIANYVGIKEYVPAYLDPTLTIEELMTGVSFASAGSGFDPLTPRLSNVISVSRQLEYFQEYQNRVELVIGKERTQNLINKALYVVSTAGTNDYVVNYFTVPIRRTSYSIPSYMDFLLQQVQLFVQDLLHEGARRIGVIGLPPLGCLPLVITLNSNKATQQSSCIESFSSIARKHNQMLQTHLSSIQQNTSVSGVRIAYVDAYGPLFDMISQSHNYGFDEVSRGCCGTGIVETSYLCNSVSNICSDASKYIFWDSIHPTEKAYNIIFEACRSDVDFLIQD